MLSLSATLPVGVHAGFFSFVANLFEPETKGAPNKVTVNSQNMALLQAALNPDPNPAKGGGDITIVGGTALLPESGPEGTLADINEHTGSDEISLYVVRSGDSLSQIAKMFGVSVNTIMWANDIRGPIKEGDKLVILPISGVQHVVKTGDTVQTIAKKYKADLQEVLQFNNLTAEAKLAVGQTIIIPDGEIQAPKATAPSNRARNTSGPHYEGYYMRPLAGGTRTQGLHGYNGVDIADVVGASVFAAAPGEVIISRNSGWNGGYGHYIVIAHNNGTQTLYSHLSEAIVPAGTTVFKGQVIGYVGSTGKSTGPHLHFEIRGAKNPF